MNIEINHLDELGNAAEALLGFAGNDKIFAFEGEMGAGKTTFIKVLCEKLGVRDVVSSPTFSIVNEYAAANQVIYHFDFYRIKNLQEVFDIGYEEYFYSGNICLIEWPERIRELLPENYTEVEIKTLSPDKRSFSFTKI
ncbi:tRNA (adenosine(37)-N6)-threonylcarbamoyltransferase complex ATPase subunit type 1 TsaE [Pedobacter cryoconitis]|uniref:tRNA threonylcarbamoyladenosine biosynthesis protein TsaE n=1 Tax=Pedobacter cryoconitis TaxID=188932 RepID=A0A7X0MHW2_9SPHI|nr:tRNA (adenosine(37)-N6)-threonylcarbamoyltransferase complex ATPase subunit type 1 TsaE [Pedobacter cryoconitis]MBB6499549.1 tRNA threonylcarbamoyladenosine biosynthesis protein TsaE [Pedobacter cryoconitis]